MATDEDAKKKARLERFAPAAKTDALEEDKRKARAIRFVSQQNFPYIFHWKIIYVLNALSSPHLKMLDVQN